MTLPTKFPARGAQYPMTAVITVNLTDLMATTAGTVQSVGGTAGSSVYLGAYLPQNSVVLSGALQVTTAGNSTGTATVAIGDTTSASRYLAATDIKTVANTAFTGVNLDNTPGNNLQLTVANADATATAGTFTVIVTYILRGRVNEAITT